MSACSNENDVSVCLFINQQPVGLNVAFPVALELTLQFMIPVLGRKCLLF